MTFLADSLSESIRVVEAPTRAGVRISFFLLVEDSNWKKLPTIHAIFTSPESSSRYPSREVSTFSLSCGVIMVLAAEPTVPAAKLMVWFFFLPDGSKLPELKLCKPSGE